MPKNIPRKEINWQHLIAVEDKLGHKTQYKYDVKGNLVAIIDKNGQRTAFGYDQGNNLIWTQNPLGYQRRFVNRMFVRSQKFR